MQADVRVLSVGYDETVIEARAEALRLSKKDCQILFIQDTTLDNYWTIPKEIMQGYMTIFSEAWQQSCLDDPDARPTHVFLQVGVGTFSGGMSGYLVNKMKAWNDFGTKIITVEPRGAHCVFYSHQRGDGQLHALEGELETIMAGLNCGTPSGLGWPMLKNCAFAFTSCTDKVTIDGMKQYYYPIGGMNFQIFEGTEEAQKGLKTVLKRVFQTSVESQRISKDSKGF